MSLHLHILQLVFPALSSGGSTEGAQRAAPPFFGPNLRAEKNFSGRPDSPPPPLSKGLDDWAPHLVSQVLDPALLSYT